MDEHCFNMGSIALRGELKSVTHKMAPTPWSLPPALVLPAPRFSHNKYWSSCRITKRGYADFHDRNSFNFLRQYFSTFVDSMWDLQSNSIKF